MPTTRPVRRPTLVAAGALAAMATLLMGACGDGQDDVTTSPGAPGTGGSVTSSPDPSTSPSATTPATPATSAPAASGETDLTVVVDDGSGNKQTWRLTCDPPGGDHPDPAAACTALATNGESALPPVPKDRMCTQIYGGPEKATVKGTWNGKPVNATFSKTNGCEVGRWQALAGLLPAAGGPNS